MSVEMHGSIQYLFRPTYKPFHILSFFALFSASFVEMSVLTSQIESVGVMNKIRKSQLESCVSQLGPDTVSHRVLCILVWINSWLLFLIEVLS